MRTTSIAISGYNGERVPNHLHQPDTPTDHLALVLPGFGYTCDMPLLYFTVNHLLERGIDVLQVEYRYDGRPDYRVATPEVRQQWLLTDVLAAWRAVFKQHNYRRYTIIGKSLGTRAMSRLLEHDPLLAGAQTIWFTPIWREEPIATALRRSSRPTLIVIGDDDPHYDRSLAEEIAANEHCIVAVIPGTDHSIEIPGDMIGSVRAVEQALRAVKRFIG